MTAPSLRPIAPVQNVVHPSLHTRSSQHIHPSHRIVHRTYEVVGKLATLGGAVIKQKANRILDDFFAHVGRELGVVP